MPAYPIFNFKSLANACKHAESFCATLSYAEFEIDRVVSRQSGPKVEWVIYLKKLHLDPSYDDDGDGPILIADPATGEITPFMKL